MAKRMLIIFTVLAAFLVIEVGSVNAAPPTLKGKDTHGLKGRSTSYNLTFGPDVLEPSYTVSVEVGTPQVVIDAMVEAATESEQYTNVPIVWEAPGSASDITIGVTDEVICGTNDAAGCAYTSFDGSKLVGTHIKVRSYVPNIYTFITPCLVKHELGHALGLSHVADESQIMNSVLTQYTPCSYQKGDANGLALAAGR